MQIQQRGGQRSVRRVEPHPLIHGPTCVDEMNGTHSPQRRASRPQAGLHRPSPRTIAP